MSKPLKTVQELWSYCLYCHICKDTCRKITLSAGPAPNFLLIHSEKEDNILNIQCVYKKRFNVTYSIDCLNNTFKIISNNSEVITSYCFFDIKSVCHVCNATHVQGADLELNLKEKTIYNIGIYNEGTYLLSTEDMYHVTLLHDTNLMLVSKCFKSKKGKIIDDNIVCALPLVDLDFSDLRKTAHRIKTMLVFS